MADGRRIVVVVDDDESIRSSLSRLFRSAGLESQTYASGEEFITSAALDTAGCCIIDLEMPGMRGPELQAYCAKHRPRVPIIVITAFHGSAIKQQTLSAGATAFVNKPFDAQALLALVERAVGVRQ